MPVSRLRPSDPVTLGPYLLLGRVASGGMGVVYLGREDGRPDSLVAVKTSRPEHGVTSDFVEDLRREARTALALAGSGHPGLARVVAVDVDGARPWIATEYVPGPTLHEAARGRGLPERDVLTLAGSLAETVAALHRGGYAHRDVKPVNIVLAPDGARLVDLGLAQRVGTTDRRRAMGSPGWSPPEQRDPGPDPRPGDVHGWGMSVAYAATGRAPFGTGPGPLVTRRMLTGAPRLTGLEEPLRGLLTAALRPDPLSRPHVDDVVDGLAASRRVNAAPGPAQEVASTRALLRSPVVLLPGTEELVAPTLVDTTEAAPRDEASHTAGRTPTADPARPRSRGARRSLSTLLAALAVLGVVAVGHGAASQDTTASPTPSASPAPSPSTRRPTPVAIRTASASAAPRASAATPPAHGKAKHHKRKH